MPTTEGKTCIRRIAADRLCLQPDPAPILLEGANSGNLRPGGGTVGVVNEKEGPEIRPLLIIIISSVLSLTEMSFLRWQGEAFHLDSVFIADPVAAGRSHVLFNLLKRWQQ